MCSVLGAVFITIAKYYLNILPLVYIRRSTFLCEYYKSTTTTICKDMILHNYVHI
jgi:hypothetical protein